MHLLVVQVCGSCVLPGQPLRGPGPGPAAGSAPAQVCGHATELGESAQRGDRSGARAATPRVQLIACLITRGWELPDPSLQRGSLEVNGLVEGWCCGIFALHCSSGGDWCGPKFAHLSGPVDFAALVASSVAPAARHEVRARARALGQSGRVCHSVCHSPPPRVCAALSFCFSPFSYEYRSSFPVVPLQSGRDSLVPSRYACFCSSVRGAAAVREQPGAAHPAWERHEPRGEGVGGD